MRGEGGAVAGKRKRFMSENTPITQLHELRYRARDYGCHSAHRSGRRVLALQSRPIGGMAKGLSARRGAGIEATFIRSRCVAQGISQFYPRPQGAGARGSPILPWQHWALRKMFEAACSYYPRSSLSIQAWTALR